MQFNLGLVCFEDVGVKQDFAAAQHWTHKAAEQGDDADAQCGLGVMYISNGEGGERDDGEALRWLRKVARQG